ncbi:MAG: response regulator [Planctomycetaceae bacterium]|nr:response regulator [Planctomycetaceae bacterium]
MVCNDVLLQPPLADLDRQCGQILIVDDDRDQAFVLSTALRRLGFQAQVAHDLATAKQKIEDRLPQLIILDIRLPDGNGLEFCAKLGDAPETFNTPVVILSGMESSDIVRQARTAGCRYFLRKPYDPNSLLLIVENALADCE